MPENWSDAEVRAAVADYFVMYEAERRGHAFNKAEHNRTLRLALNKRSKSSVEMKHQNISAALIDHGLPYLPGYVPYGNYQKIVFEIVGEVIDARPDLVSLVAAEVVQPAPLPSVDDILATLVDPPKLTPIKYPGRVGERKTRRLNVDYLAVEASNRSLGLAGEEHAVRYEIARLLKARRDKLAARVRHISVTEGDGAGFDILSFEESGAERFVEVKTTSYPIATPFYLSRNEVQTSQRLGAQFQLYRLFDFRRKPQLFALPGDLSKSCKLDPVQFRARVG